MGRKADAMKVGDVVRFKLGGPHMEITHVYEAGDCNAGKVEVYYTETVRGKNVECYEVLSSKVLEVADLG